MNEYEFTLTFQLKEPQSNPEEFVDALFEANCDDAIPGIGKLGYLSLGFIRGGTNAFDAVTSAIADASKAVPDAKLIEATPDIGGISDIAELLQCSRQNIRQLIFSAPTIPPPIHGGKSPIWHMSDVLLHLANQKRCQVSPHILDLTAVNRAINSQNSTNLSPEVLSSIYPDVSKYLTRLTKLLSSHPS